jgi:hypothetical protein
MGTGSVESQTVNRRSAMNQAQRIVLIAYCVVVAYCCLWIPWHVRLRSPSGALERVGYGWAWAGPYRSAPTVHDPPISTSEGLKVLGEEDLRSSWVDLTAEPDLPLTGLRYIAVTSLSATAFLLAGLWKPARSD